MRGRPSVWLDDVPEDTMTQPSSEVPEAGRPAVLRGGTVLPMDDACSVLTDADVLVVGDRIEAVGRGSRSPRARPRSTRAVASPCPA